MSIAILFLAVVFGANAQYLGNEPAVAPLLEGIRFCAMEPMAGAENVKGLQWLKEVRSGDQTCTKNAAVVPDQRGVWLVYENKAGQVRVLRLGDMGSPGIVDSSICQQIQNGVSGPDFSMRNLAERVAEQQKQILLASESARPSRTTEDRLQFALCHDSLVKLMNVQGLRKILSRAENERLTRVHRGDNPVPHGGGGAAGR